jgi:hypothetical protein
MKKLEFFLIGLVLTLVTACSSKKDDLAQSDWDRQGEREYVATWSVQDIPVIEVTLTYHGKTPSLPFDGPEPSYDWKSRDTDFYSCVLRNLTDYPVQLREVHAEMEKGSFSSSPPKDSVYLAERWGSSVLPPRGSLTRRNTWVWGKGAQNTLHKTFRAEILPAGNEASTAAALEALIEKGGGQAAPFSFQTPLRYQR